MHIITSLVVGICKICMWIEHEINRTENNVTGLGVSYYFCRFIMKTEYCERYAKEENISNINLEESDDDISNEDISDGQSTSSDDNIAGVADP